MPLDNTNKRGAEVINGKNPQAKHIKRSETVPPVILTLDDNKGNFKQMNTKQLKDFEKALREAVGGSPRETEIMRGGDLLIKPKDADQAKKFLSLNKRKIVNRNILCDYPNSYYAAFKGQITNVPISFTDEEMLDALSHQAVISVERRKRMEKNNNKEELIPTEQVILTFSRSLPEKVKMFGISSPVSVYYEKPRKCYGKCWRLGHYAGKCRSTPTCKTCGNAQHGPSIPCHRRCINCNREDHDADQYNKCPAYIEAQEAIYLSVDEDIPVKVALRFLREERMKTHEEEPEMPPNNNNSSSNSTRSTRPLSQVVANGSSLQHQRVNNPNLIDEVASLRAEVQKLSTALPEIRSQVVNAVATAQEAITRTENLDSKISETLDKKLEEQTKTLSESITKSVLDALSEHLSRMVFPAAQTHQHVTTIPETQMPELRNTNVESPSAFLNRDNSLIIGQDPLLGTTAPGSSDMDIEDPHSPINHFEDQLPPIEESDPDEE